MTPDILVLRPRPGADETAARAKALGLHAVVTPLFAIAPVAWDAPDPAHYDALLMTSANAARCGGKGLKGLVHLRCYAVGEATAAAATEAGFYDVRIGPGDGAAAVALMEADGIRRALHLCGRDHIPLRSPEMVLDRRIVYAAEAVEELPSEASAGLQRGALPLLHSPRAAAHFAALVDKAGLSRQDIALASISEAAAEAAGSGWKVKAAAPYPRDEALLELARKLCKTDASAMRPKR